MSSFVGFFPVEDPKYSCIVVIHKPNNKTGYYGADVSGPVFKRIAQKIFTDTPVLDQFDNIDQVDPEIETNYEKYFAAARQQERLVPDLAGLPAMDAVSLLENLGVKYELTGSGEVVQQSVKPGTEIDKNLVIKLKLS